MTAPATGSVDPAAVLDRTIAALKVPGSVYPLDELDLAIRMSPRDARLWHVKGLAHRDRDERELAIPALKQAVALAPTEPLIAHGYARTLLEAGLPAVDPFGLAVKLNPGKPEVLRGLIAALVAEGRTGEAIAGLETILRGSPAWADGHTLLASLRWAEGERDGFDRSFDAALTIHPDSLDLRRAQLAVLIHAARWEDAFRALESGRQALGEQPLFILDEAIVRDELGETEAAGRLLGQLSDLPAPDVAVRRIRNLLRSGRPKDASDQIEPWLQTPHQDLFWHYAATIWRMTGDPRAEWLEGDERLIGAYDIAGRLPSLPRLAEILRSLHRSHSQPLAQSVRGGTQTDGNLFQRIEPEIVQLRESIREAVAEHAARLPPSDPAHPLLRYPRSPIRFSGAWSVRLQAGGSHANHVHPQGWLSSALYIVLPPDLGREGAGLLTLGEPQSELKLDLPPLRTIEPRPGRLALFPSWMWHGTRPFGEGERMTVAFDVARPG